MPSHNLTTPLPHHPTFPATAALSVRQPWAALIVAGMKTVEVRTWATRRRGPVLIHTGKLIDPRPQAWAWIDTPELRDLAALRGGVVGAAEVAGCLTYDTPAGFAADAARHRNAPAWFAPPRLYGFELRDARAVNFYPYPGRTMFFEVDDGSVPDRA